VTNSTLAQSYLVKARSRLKILAVLLDDQNYSDVVREGQEIVELALKGMLRQIGVEPPHIHDVGGLLKSHRNRFPSDVREQIDALASGSAWLRKEREFSFYGDIDFIPTEQYGRPEADRAVAEATLAVEVARTLIDPVPAGPVPSSAD
jgi:HEPN domain-containing protein